MITQPMRQIYVFDTTLRDGEQSPGCTMNLKDKLLAAEHLEELRVDVIEAGFAIASSGDFESVRAISGVVSLADAESGVPVAMAAASQKEGEGKKCEMAVARRLIRQSDLSNALVSADALHCQQETVREITMSGGEALVQVKGNQKSILAACESVADRRAHLFAQHP